jgi:hypothetical protein
MEVVLGRGGMNLWRRADRIVAAAKFRKIRGF